MTSYLYLIKLRLLTALTYRFEVFASIGTNIILMFASVFLWKTAYRGVDTVAGLEERQMVTYAIVSILLGAVFTCNVENVINGRIREGEIATDLIRPVNLMLCWLSEDIGESVCAIAIRFAPLLVLATLFFQAPLPSSLTAGVLFLLSCLLSFGILWLLSALVGVAAFRILELGNMGIVKDAIVRLLSGSIVPLWLFPKSVVKISAFLPFQYTYQTPLGIYIGKLAPAQALSSMAVQGLWIAVLGLLLVAAWNKAKRHVMVQGG